MTLRTLTEISAKGDILVFDGPVRLDLARPQLLLLATFCRAGDSTATSVMHGAWAPGGRPGSGQGFAPRRVPPAHTARASHPAGTRVRGRSWSRVSSEFKGAGGRLTGPFDSPMAARCHPAYSVKVGAVSCVIAAPVSWAVRASAPHPLRGRCAPHVQVQYSDVGARMQHGRRGSARRARGAARGGGEILCMAPSG